MNLRYLIFSIIMTVGAWEFGTETVMNIGDDTTESLKNVFMVINASLKEVICSLKFFLDILFSKK